MTTEAVHFKYALFYIKAHNSSNYIKKLFFLIKDVDVDLKGDKLTGCKIKCYHINCLVAESSCLRKTSLYQSRIYFNVMQHSIENVLVIEFLCQIDLFFNSILFYRVNSNNRIRKPYSIIRNRKSISISIQLFSNN